MKIFRTNQRQPISQKNIIRMLVILVVILSITAGFFQAAYKLEIKKYSRLEDKYVRVRTVLGREETQRIIDSTHE